MTYNVFGGTLNLAPPNPREFRVALPWELLYADDLVVEAETESDLIKAVLTVLWFGFCHTGPISLCVLHICCVTVITVGWTWWD